MRCRRQDNARRLIGERDRHQHARFASQHLFEPRTLWCAAFARLLHDGTTADDEEAPERALAHFGRCAKLLLAACRSLKGRETRQAAKSRPLAKVSAGGARAAIAVAEIGPMPGMVISRRDTSSSRARRAISLSRSAIVPLRLSELVQHHSEHGAGRFGKRTGHRSSSIRSASIATCDGPFGAIQPYR